MYDNTKLVSKKVFKELLFCLPTGKQKRFGRKRIAKEALLGGILQVLVNGVSWNKIAGVVAVYTVPQKLDHLLR